METPSGPSQWDALAKAIASESGLRMLRQMQAAGIISAAAGPISPKIVTTNQADLAPYQPVSIWVPVEREGVWVFERPAPGPFDDHYGKQASFALEKPAGTKRIAFFGESVAAGYLLAPYLTPAMVLERKLKLAYPQSPIEVMDFSRTNETLDSMTLTARAACQLSPDLMIFFAGNNWPLLEMPEYHSSIPSVSTRQALAESWRSGGMPQVKAEEQRVLLKRTAAKLDGLGQFLKEAGLPAVWLIPEVNLVDWDHGQPLPCLAPEAFRGWYATLEQALAFLEKGAFEKAEAAAWALLEKDDGACSVGYRILGKALLAQDRPEEARLAFEYEVQNGGYAGTCFLGAPQITHQLRQLITQFAARAHIVSVDLRETFSKHRPGKLPDRFFFLDYCHLTKEGTALAMDALLGPVGDLLFLGKPKPVGLHEGSEMHAQAEAIAYIGAAIHSCHRQVPTLQSETPWRAWLQKALAVDGNSAIHLVNYVKARLSRAPIVFSKAQADNFDSDLNVNPQHGWFYDFLDAAMLDIIFEILASHHPAEKERLLAQMIANWAVEKHPVDLLQPPFFLWQPLARMLTDVMTHASIARCAFLRCMQPQTAVAFVTSGNTDLLLEVTCRLPPKIVPDGTSEVALMVNGVSVTSFELGARWNKYELELPKNVLVAGLNKLAFSWPMPTLEGAFELISDRLTMGRDCSLFPVFAQIHAIKMGAP